MKILNKKGSIPIKEIMITNFIISIIACFIISPIFSEIGSLKWFILSLVSGFFCLFLFFLMIYAKASFDYYIETHKNWLEFYKDDISEITIKSLLDEINDYTLIKKKALEIYKDNEETIFFEYIRKNYYILNLRDEGKILFKSKKYRNEISEKFYKSIPLILDEIKKAEYVSFNENKYSTLRIIEDSLAFLNVSSNEYLWYHHRENIIGIANSRIMKNTINEYSKEEILARILVPLFYESNLLKGEKYEEIK